MNIALKVVEGPLKGKVFPVEKSLSIGRTGDITLEDPTVSGIHATIEPNAEGDWILKDNESKNGIRVGEKKIRQARLKTGMIFYIGDHGFEVFESKKAAQAETVVMPSPKPKPVQLENMPKKAEPKPAPAPTPEAPKKKQKYWNEAIAEFLKSNKDAFKDRALPLIPLEPAVILEFVRGIQLNAKWVLGYGPRKLGPGTVDLPIWEPGAPEICFEIQPTSEGILFKTQHPDVVLLNNEQVDSQLLRVGDTISIHETLIEVDFTE